MIINHQHKYLFVQSPHTGCTAVAKELVTNYGGEHILWKHAMFHNLLHRHPEIEIADYFVFSTVRNPYTELTSIYHKLKNDHEEYSNPKNWCSNGGWLSKRGLKQFRFIHDNKASFGQYLRKFYRFPFVTWNVLDHKQFDYVMRFERLSTDFEQALSQIGISQIRPLPVVNKTEKKPLTEITSSNSTQKFLVYALSPLMEFWNYDFPKDTGLLIKTTIYSRILFWLNLKIRTIYWRRKK